MGSVLFNPECTRNCSSAGPTVEDRATPPDPIARFGAEDPPGQRRVTNGRNGKWMTERKKRDRGERGQVRYQHSLFPTSSPGYRA